jgi:hypothetical protein
MQFAVAAYACQAVQADQAMTAMAAGQPCHGIDQERPKLCEQHCTQAFQSVDTQPHNALSAPVLPVIAVVFQSDLDLSIRPNVRGALLATVVDLPPLIRFGVLRI